VGVQAPAPAPAEDPHAPPRLRRERSLQQALEEEQGGAERVLRQRKALISEEIRAQGDVPVPYEDCVALFAASPAVQIGEVHHLGFTNMMLEATDVVAHACDAGASILLGGIYRDVGGGTAAPRVDVSQLFDVGALNVALAGTAVCSKTRVIPRYCLTYGVVVSGVPLMLGVSNGEAWDVRVPIELAARGRMFDHEGRLENADGILMHLQLRNVVNWQAQWLSGTAGVAGVVELEPQSYDAVHFNLDTDWILMRRDGVEAWGAYFNADLEEQQRIERECCSRDAKPEHVAWIRGAIAAYNAACSAHLSQHPPVVIATSIGKDPSHTATQWILDEFVAANSQLRFAIGITDFSYRELNAAAEASILFNSRSFIAFPGSTFSHLVKRKVLGNGGAFHDVEMASV